MSDKRGLMTAPRRIGILGGMGPEATVLLMSRLIAATPASDDFDHIPLMVDMNPQVPSRIARLIEGRGEDPGPVLAAIAAGLQRSGAEALAMPCNTAHHYAPDVRDAVSIPFLDMVKISAKQVAQKVGRGGSVGILGSPALRQVGIFDHALARHGCEAVYATDQDALLAAICEMSMAAQNPASRAPEFPATGVRNERFPACRGLFRFGRPIDVRGVVCALGSGRGGRTGRSFRECGHGG